MPWRLFRLEAMDYLLKPLDRGRLAETIDRARRVILEKKSSEPAAARAAAPVATPRTKLMVKAANRNFIVDASDVIYATIDSGLITLVTTSFEGQSNYRTIEDLQANLDRELFWRVHRSLPGEHQPHQGSGALVQIELPAPHGR